MSSSSPSSPDEGEVWESPKVACVIAMVASMSALGLPLVPTLVTGFSLITAASQRRLRDAAPWEL